jgi:hypothetical protein
MFGAPKSSTFGLGGPVSVGEALVMLDGGSIKIGVHDGQARELRIFYRDETFGDPKGYGGHVSLELPGIEGRFLLTKGSPEELRLVRLLKEAEQASFGPGAARNRDDSFRRKAVNAVIRILSARQKAESE